MFVCGGPEEAEESLREKLEAEDLEVAFAGEDDGEKAAVGGEGVFADGEAVEKLAGFRLEDGDGLVAVEGGEAGNAEADEVRGFFFDGALDVDFGFVGVPLKDAQADAHAGDASGMFEVADFQNFTIDKIGNF